MPLLFWGQIWYAKIVVLAFVGLVLLVGVAHYVGNKGLFVMHPILYSASSCLSSYSLL